MIGLALVVPLLWSLLTWPILQPSRHRPAQLAERPCRYGWSTPLFRLGLGTPRADEAGHQQRRCRGHPRPCAHQRLLHAPTDRPGCAVTDVNHDNQNSVLDIVRVAVRWYQPFTRIADGHPSDGEDDVSITRETVIRFPHAIDARGHPPFQTLCHFHQARPSAPGSIFSSDMKTVTLFYDPN